MNSHISALQQAIETRQACVGIVGLGYVGLPLAVEFGRGGFQVLGVDTDEGKVTRLREGQSYVLDVQKRDVEELVGGGRIEVSNSYELLSRADTISITVPTPLRKTKDPDVSFIMAAVEGIKPILRKGTLIVLESTTYPGTTREVIGGMLEEAGYRPGEDIFVAFSPERVDPGNRQYHTKNTPKVVGGLTPACTELARRLYAQVIDTVVPVHSAEEAEMVKLLENTFRAVNIGLVNELMLMCDRMGIDIWNVIEAAKTKPFGYMAFYPGPGIGGHCIPLDPMYLAWKGKMYDFYNRFIELATDINGNMPRYVVQRLTHILNRRRLALNGSRVLILGMAYKSDIDDVRESPAYEIFKMLQAEGCQVEYHDPHVPAINGNGRYARSVELDAGRLEEYDAAVLVTHHQAFDLSLLQAHCRVILDCRNAFKDFDPAQTGNIVKL